MSINIALVGNPNSGKTTLFNELTGSNQHVGNWPGVTVEKKVGKAKINGEIATIVDLPGIYSLSTMSVDEVITREYVEKGDVDVIINIIDASHLERNLFLTLQLIEMRKPMIVALNMMDVLKSKGLEIDLELLSNYLNIPVIPIVASKSKGIKECLKKAIQQVGHVPELIDYYSDSTKSMIDYLSRSLEDHSKCTLHHAIRFIEEGPEGAIGCDIDVVSVAKLNEWVEDQFAGTKLERDMIIADEKYQYITSVIKGAVVKTKDEGESTSDKIDKILTHKYLAIPIFLAIMYSVFFVAFGPLGSFVKDYFEVFIEWIIYGIANLLEWLNVSDIVSSLVVDGILGGVGAVLSFLPEISILFLMLSLLENSGYMSRAAFIMDRMFRRFGLSGRSFIPMLMGFGCTVPALMATRTLENEKERRLTMFIIPFMSCGAKFPVYAIFAVAFFASNQAFIVFSIYVLGIIVAILSGIILKRFINKGKTTNFIMELPEYRWPTLKNLIIHTWDRIKGFVVNAGTVILLAMIVIWFLQSFNFQFQLVEDSAESIFGIIGRSIAFIFAPLGFGEWRAAMSLVVGFVAKEAVVGTLGVLYGVGETAIETPELLAAPLRDVFTPLSAYSFMIFTLLYLPCVAAFAAMKREMNSWKWTILAITYQTGIAWLLAFAFYQVGSFIVG
jgi:ferrous iron transport protein B